MIDFHGQPCCCIQKNSRRLALGSIGRCTRDCGQDEAAINHLLSIHCFILICLKYDGSSALAVGNLFVSPPSVVSRYASSWDSWCADFAVSQFAFSYQPSSPPQHELAARSRMPLAQKLARFENLAAVATSSGYQLLGLLSRPWPAVLFFFSNGIATSATSSRTTYIFD